MVVLLLTWSLSMIISNASSSIASGSVRYFARKVVFFFVLSHLLPKAVGCRRGFLTPRDCMVVIYASITFALYCLTSVDAMQSSRFYTFDKVLEGSFVSATYHLLPVCRSIGLNVGITDGLSYSLFYRQVNRICTYFCFRKISLHTSLKIGGCTLLRFLSYP